MPQLETALAALRESFRFCSVAKPACPLTHRLHPGPNTRDGHGGRAIKRRQHSTAQPDLTQKSNIWDWPEPDEGSTIPSPYQILNTSKGHSYTKRRYYELVKLYHPDKSTSDSHPTFPCPLSHPERIERFQLIVQAHNILSDPSRRHAYDAYGLGWLDFPNRDDDLADFQSNLARRSRTKGKDAWTGFQSNVNSASRNATWEDWEKWYAANAPPYSPKAPPHSQDSTPQDTAWRVPVTPARISRYYSNIAILSIIVALGSLGAAAELSRAKSYATDLIQRRAEIHSEANKRLFDTRIRTREAPGSDRDERVQQFVHSRQERIDELQEYVDGGAQGGEEDERYEALLNLPGRCGVGGRRAVNDEGQGEHEGLDGQGRNGEG